MKFLADQDVYASTIGFLSGLGHDVVPAARLGLAQAEDAELLRIAHEQGRILLTRDRDFGGLVFVQGGGPGVIYLRVLPSTQNAVHAELERIPITGVRAHIEVKSTLELADIRPALGAAAELVSARSETRAERRSGL